MRGAPGQDMKTAQTLEIGRGRLPNTMQTVKDLNARIAELERRLNELGRERRRAHDRGRTIAREARVSGIGLHSGERCTVVFKPAPANSGMTFVRTDPPGMPAIVAHPARLCQRMRRTAIADRVGGVEVEVHTTEHCLASPPRPGHRQPAHRARRRRACPASTARPCDQNECLRSAGIVEQQAARKAFDLESLASISDSKSSVVALPYKDGLKITYTLDDHGGAIGGAQVVEIELSESRSLSASAPARTFCLAKDWSRRPRGRTGQGRELPEHLRLRLGTRVIDQRAAFPTRLRATRSSICSATPHKPRSA